MAAIGELVARGGRYQAAIAASVLSGRLSLTVDEVSQFDLRLCDSDGMLARARMFGPGAQIDIGAYPMQVSAYELGEDPEAGQYLDVTARSWGAQKMREARGERSWPNMSPSQFVQRSAAFYGLKSIVETTPLEPSIDRAGPDPRKANDPGESDWDVMQRLAEELGFIAFEALGTVYFGRPSWLVRVLPRVTVTWGARSKVDGSLLRMPTCRRTADDPKAPRTVDLHLTQSVAAKYRPGMAVDLRGVPDFETRYIVAGVDIDFDDTREATVRCRTVLDPTPVVDDATGAASVEGSATASDVPFAKFVNAIVGQESNRYDDVNPRTGALGRYQVLPRYVGPWSREILNRTVTPGEFLRNPRIQDQVAIWKLRKLYDAYGPRGAAAAWYSGDAARQNDTRHNPKYPSEPSVAEYVAGVVAKMATARVSLPSGYTGPGAMRADVVTGPMTFEQLLRVMTGSGIPHRAVSTIRVGAVTRSGGTSFHAKGQAVDFAGTSPGRDTPQLLAINRFWARFAPGLTELIYSGPGAVNILSGRPHTFSAGVQSDHHDHVHVAATRESLAKIAHLL